MYKNILVPVDFSQKSIVALKSAINLAVTSQGEIDVMNVVEVPLAVRAIGDRYETTAPKGKELLSFLLESSKTRMEGLVKKVEAKGITINIKTKVDPAPENLAELITERRYDLIVIGGITKPFDEFLRKTYPEQIVELAKSPVLSINSKLEDYQSTKIVLPTNLIDDYTKHLPTLQSYQELFDTSLHVVYVNTPADFKTSKEIDYNFERFKEKHQLGEETDYSIYCDKTIRNGIINFSNKIEADTIAVFSKHKDNFFKVIRGDITEYLVNHSTIPVLTFNMKMIKAS